MNFLTGAQLFLLGVKAQCDECGGRILLGDQAEADHVPCYWIAGLSLIYDIFINCNWVVTRWQ